MRQREKCVLKPAPGRRVKDPETMRLLADEGEEKPLTSYWLRRLVDEDVVRVSATPEKPAPKSRRAEPTAKEE